MIVHIMDQPELGKVTGCFCLFVCLSGVLSSVGLNDDRAMGLSVLCLRRHASLHTRSTSKQKNSPRATISGMNGSDPLFFVVLTIRCVLGLGSTAVLYGGSNKLDQIKDLRSGVEILVATPVRPCSVVPFRI
jgi:hypothetical protein